MGMNYYWNFGASMYMPVDRQLHIGKVSMGWTFALHVYPHDPKLPQDFGEWKTVWRFGKISDEDGTIVSPREMERIVMRAHMDPSRLKRRPVGEGGVIAHGSGPWDIVTGEFC